METAWYFPSGDRLPLSGQAGLTEARGYHRVDSYVDLNEVEDPSQIASDASIRCHTDLSSCCSGGQGEHHGDCMVFP